MEPTCGYALCPPLSEVGLASPDRDFHRRSLFTKAIMKGTHDHDSLILHQRRKTYGNLSKKRWRAAGGDQTAAGLRYHWSAAQHGCHSHPWGHASWLQRLARPRQQPRTGGGWVDTNH